MINPLSNGMGAVGGSSANPLGGMSIGGGNGLGGFAGGGGSAGIGGIDGDTGGSGGGANLGGGLAIGPNQQATGAQATSFSNVIGDMIVKNPTKSHAYADNLASRLAAGENVDPHQLALATAKAGLEIQMSTRTISQAVSAVRTLFQMQI